MNAQRYRLEGFRSSNGQVSLQARPAAASRLQSSQEPAAVAVDDVKAVVITAA
jgi:hypothetical protein